jgi:hypothetical protein
MTDFMAPSSASSDEVNCTAVAPERPESIGQCSQLRFYMSQKQLSPDLQRKAEELRKKLEEQKGAAAPKQ